MKPEDVYAALFSAVSDHLKEYRDELEVHDKNAIERYQNVPFLHITRTTPRRLMILQRSHILLTDGLTFIFC